MDMASFITTKAVCMMAIGKIILCMAKGICITQMGGSLTKENGEWMNFMATAKFIIKISSQFKVVMITQI